MAKKVLEGKTKANQNHPQLLRFKKYQNPLVAINAYLYQIYQEAKRRGYNFNPEKMEMVALKKIMPVPKGQVDFEFSHLLNKLKRRDRKKYKELRKVTRIAVNPIFRVEKGGMADWEKFSAKRFVLYR